MRKQSFPNAGFPATNQCWYKHNIAHIYLLQEKNLNIGSFNSKLKQAKYILS